MSQPNPSVVTICGVKVQFPDGRKPFPQQLGVMQKIIASLIRSEHALLESPTGTGKTLALLCASLAWQRKHAADLVEITRKAEVEYAARMCELEKLAAVPGVNVVEAMAALNAAKENSSKEHSVEKTSKGRRPNSGNKYSNGIDAGHDGDDFEDQAELVSVKKKPIAAAPKIEKAMPNLHPPLDVAEPVVPTKPYVRIFYSSRTHSQLKQVVAELKRCHPELLLGPTDTSGLRMVVLGSRDHYCINPDLKDLKGGQKGDACKEKVKHTACEWHKRNSFLASHTANIIQDIEELTKDGKTLRGCSFFASRLRNVMAHITFLPYNYLMDSGIRRNMSIDLKGSVIIIDEAHNIEDVCREGASLELALDSFNSVIKVLKNAQRKRPDLEQQLVLCQDLVESLCNWASERPQATGDNFLTESEGIVLQGPEAIESWESGFGLVINPLTLDAYRTAMTVLEKPPPKIEEDDEEEDLDMNAHVKPDQSEDVVPSAIMQFLDTVISRLEYMTMESGRFSRDFRVAVVSKWVSASNPGTDAASQLIATEFVDDELGGTRKTKKARQSGAELFLCIWCMNPAVAFQAVKNEARSIILTSGTLSPIKAFAAELGCEFKHTLEAMHVCDIRQQLFASSFSVMNGELLDATFKNAERFQYLNALGEAIQLVSEVTPGGLLVFFPSYAMLERCANRWKATGLYDKLDEAKPIFTESRSNSKDFERSILRYRDQCKTEKGAIFFAVFRGKLSEGIDFKDEAARAVVIIGIPFPNVKDIVVGLKKSHQDAAKKRCPESSLTVPLNGQEWYQQQAYRALNQALGRVIRHRYDYGAIILLDHRFTQRGVIENLSKWMRNAVAPTYDVTDAAGPLRAFFKRLQENPPGVDGVATTNSQPTPSTLSSQPSSIMRQPSIHSASSYSSVPMRPLSQDDDESQLFSRSVVAPIKLLGKPPGSILPTIVELDSALDRKCVTQSFSSQKENLNETVVIDLDGDDARHDTMPKAHSKGENKTENIDGSRAAPARKNRPPAKASKRMAFSPIEDLDADC